MWLKTKINALINVALGDKELLLDASAAVLHAKKAPKPLDTTLYASDGLSRCDGGVIDHLP
jgi:hypothetical protein